MRRFWIIVKIISALMVVFIMVVTCILTYHITVSPLDGAFAKLVPEPGSVKKHQSNVDMQNVLASERMPDVDPGEKAFEIAYDLLAQSRLAEARQKLTTIFNIYPNSASAATARRIIGEMNLDRILGSNLSDGKTIHTVQRGDSYLAIASKYNTTIDCMIHLNSMLELEGIQPGDRLVVMPLEFRLLIEPERKSVSLWQDGQFIREYPAISMRGVPNSKKQTSIKNKFAEMNGEGVLPQSESYPSADKILQLTSPSLQIRAWDEQNEDLPLGILLRPRDMQEIALLTRPGNSVEIR